MNLLEQNRNALLAMANGELDEPSRQALQTLMEQDAECRAYFLELCAVTDALRADADLTEQRDLPLGSRQRVRMRLKQAIAPQTQSSLLSASRWKPILSGLGLAILVTLIVLQFLPRETVSPALVKQQLEIPSHDSLDSDSWGQLREATRQSPVQLASLPSRTVDREIPSMNWANREAWIKKLDL